MFTGIVLILVNRPAEINAVPQHPAQRAADQRSPDAIPTDIVFFGTSSPTNVMRSSMLAPHV
jgi:hypothetical protein